MTKLSKIATWNINSLRVRLPQLLTWLGENQPDVIALQETKVQDKDFPQLDLQKAGYQCFYAGEKSYNGVALLSKFPIHDVLIELPGFTDPQRRILAGTVEGVRIINLYVPNGQNLTSEKYQYKLTWMDQLINFLKLELTKYEEIVVLGDFNIAPDHCDVHDPELWQGQVLVSDLERKALSDLMALGFYDAFRLFETATGHFTWWDYRMGAFRRNRGLRIDHILLSAQLKNRTKGCVIDKNPRGWERPSDHAPVLALFG